MKDLFLLSDHCAPPGPKTQTHLHPVAQWLSTPMQETGVQSLGQEDPLEEETATHSSILAWRLPMDGEPGGPQSMGSEKSQTRLRD